MKARKRNGMRSFHLRLITGQTAMMTPSRTIHHNVAKVEDAADARRPFDKLMVWL